MPGVFIGSTEIVDVGDIKVGSTDVQEIYVGSTKIWPQTGGDPSITFTWDPENDGVIPGGTTFTRSSVAIYFDGTNFPEASSGTRRDDAVAKSGGAKGYLSEPLATNQLDNIDVSTWGLTNVTITDNGAVLTSLNEYEIDAGTSTGDHRAFKNATVGAAGSAYSIAKQGGGGGRYLNVRRGDNSNADYATYDLQAGTITEEDPGIDQSLITALSGSWFKGEINTSDPAINYQLAISDSATPGIGRPSFTGANELIDTAHNQYENTIFSTSPIGGAGTRQADVLDLGIAVTTEFSALLDLTLPDVIGTSNTITLLGPDTSAVDVLRVDDGFNIIMDDGGTPVTVGASSAGARLKVSYGRDGSGRSASLDGATAVTGGAPAAGHEGENFELGSRAGVNQSRCIHHLTTLYDVRKSDAELEALSS